MNTTPTLTTATSHSRNWKNSLALFATALWWGSLTAVGFMVVPQLFASLDSPATAGRMAAKLFSTQTWVSCACALVLLMAVRAKMSEMHEGSEGSDGHHPGMAVPLNAAIFWPVLGMMLALLSEFAVAPRILVRENLALWHSLGSAMYLAQWGCAGVSLWRVARQA